MAELSGCCEFLYKKIGNQDILYNLFKRLLERSKDEGLRPVSDIYCI